MTVRNLDSLFRPKSVALIGASDRPRSVGASVMANLRAGVFAGPIWAVNPRHATVETRVARNGEEAAHIAVQLGFPVALKILSSDISHKSDVGGVALDLLSAEDVRTETSAMERRCAERRPGAKLAGFSVQRMVNRSRAHELILGATTDLVFGPVILFGQGGTAVEVVADKAVALPPLNLLLARDVISRTRVAKLLDGYRDRPPIDREALELALVKVSQLVCDQPEIAELDINPLFADAEGVIALDARARVVDVGPAGADRLAIRPYPGELEENIVVDGMPVLLRPIRPEDETRHREFLGRVEPDDLHLRFFHARRSFAHSELARFTQIDYDREMAFIATRPNEAGAAETLGVARAIADPDGFAAEFAVLVRSDLKRRGLGRALLGKLLRYCQGRDIKEIFGDVLTGNRAMLAFVASCGFTVSTSPHDPSVVRVTLALNSRHFPAAPSPISSG